MSCNNSSGSNRLAVTIEVDFVALVLFLLWLGGAGGEP